MKKLNKPTTMLVAFAIAAAMTGCSKDDEDLEKEYSYKATGSVDGHEYVDLGLSVSWATCNVGAYNISDGGGDYFFGDRNGTLTLETAETYDFPKPPIKGTYYDIATAKWGKNWSLPSEDETWELIENCTTQRCKINGTDGYRVTGPNGNSIFLPCVYLYDSAEYNPEKVYKCIYMTSGEGSGGRFWSLHLKEENLASLLNTTETCTMAVRPVTKYGATGGSGNSGGGNNGNSGGSTGGGGSTSYEKPDIALEDYTTYPTKVKVNYRIYNQDKAKVTSAKVYYGTSSPSKSISTTVAGTLITTYISGLKKGTTYYVKCIATGKGGSTTSETTRIITDF